MQKQHKSFVAQKLALLDLTFNELNNEASSQAVLPPAASLLRAKSSKPITRPLKSLTEKNRQTVRPRTVAAPLKLPSTAITREATGNDTDEIDRFDLDPEESSIDDADITDDDDLTSEDVHAIYKLWAMERKASTPQTEEDMTYLRSSFDTTFLTTIPEIASDTYSTISDDSSQTENATSATVATPVFPTKSNDALSQLSEMAKPRMRLKVNRPAVSRAAAIPTSTATVPEAGVSASEASSTPIAAPVTVDAATDDFSFALNDAAFTSSVRKMDELDSNLDVLKRAVADSNRVMTYYMTNDNY